MTAFVLELPVARGPLDPDERECARRLGKHMKEALFAYQRMRALLAQALAGHTLLAGFAYPMWLIGEHRCVAFENPAAAGHVEQATRVVRRGLHLALTHGRADRALTERLHALVRAGHGATALIDLPANGAEPPIWLHLSLRVPSAVLGAFGERPQVLAALFDPQQVSALDPFALASMFGLTPTEAKVAIRMANGLSAAQMGKALGTAQTTVRSQVRRVIHKLGATRSVDVVRILRQGEPLWAATNLVPGGHCRASTRSGHPLFPHAHQCWVLATQTEPLTFSPQLSGAPDQSPPSKARKSAAASGAALS